MSKIYDCKGYCLSLQQFEISDKEEKTGCFSCALKTSGYYCALTNKRCTGAKKRTFEWLDDKLDLDIVERCPSRKTIDTILQEYPGESEILMKNLFIGSKQFL